MDQRYGLRYTGTYYQNDWGMQERWMQAQDESWWAILPNGEVRRWGGSWAASTLMATLDPSYYATPALLHDPQRPALTLQDNLLTISPQTGFVGSFQVQATASDGMASSSETFLVSVTDGAPVLTPVGDQTMPHTQDTLSLTLSATDPDGDAVTYAATLLATDPLAQTAYDLDQRLGLRYTGSYYQNDWGMQERWMQAQDNSWWAILPNGEVRRWGGSWETSPVLATLDPSYYANPALLHDAQRPVPTIAAGDVTLGLQGNQLTIDPRSGFTGVFHVLVTASDGVYSPSETFRVTVANTAPNLAHIGDQTMPHTQDTLSLTLSATDPDGDPVTYAASVVSLDSSAQKAWDLDQQYGLRYTGAYYQNDWGMQERWMQAQDKSWWAILPNGEVHRWGGSWATSPLIATLDSATTRIRRSYTMHSGRS